MTFAPSPRREPRAVEGATSADLLADLHRQVLAATGGTSSVVLHRSAASGAFRASSGQGCTDPGEIWTADDLAAPFDEALLRGPIVRSLEALPALSRRLGGHEALIVPLHDSGERACLVVAAPAFAESAIPAAVNARVGFSLALKAARLEKRQAVYDNLQQLFMAFTRGIAATLSLRAPLDALALDANTLLGTERVSVWLHDRRARHLTMAACSSDPSCPEAPVSTDAEEPAARGLRLQGPQFEGTGTPRVLAPLRGWRRALGTVILDGAPRDLDEGEYLDAVRELARQLSGAIENVQLVDELLQQRRLLEDTFDSLADLVVVVDTDQHVVQSNEAFAARLGAPRGTLLRQPLGELLGAEIAAWVATPEPGEAPAAARSRHFSSQTLGGEFWATVTSLINRVGDPAGQVLVIRDITAQTELEREQAALRGRLTQSEKLASLGQFVAGIAHEINNPLQGVLGHLELLMTASEDARPLRPTLRLIYQEGNRAARIVRNLLVFTGSRKLVRRRLRIDRVLSRAIASRSAALRRARITVVRHGEGTLPAVIGDPLLLQQAFLNVLINAEHAIAARGNPTASTEPGCIEIATSAIDGGRVRTTIRDTGPGIPSDVLPRIFDPFFTTKEVGQGAGLGLAITYGIIQEHGGSIQAANGIDGAIFTIDLPAFTPDGA